VTVKVVMTGSITRGSSAPATNSAGTRISMVPPSRNVCASTLCPAASSATALP
jgi:hypothetical protein